jgi:hypothetical protein
VQRCDVREQLGEPEVEQLDVAAVRHDRIGRLEIAVQDALAMRRREPTRKADRDLEEPRPRDRPRDLVEAVPADVLRDQVRPRADLADAVYRDDVRVLHARRGTGLGQEPLADGVMCRELGDELHRDQAVEHGVVSEPDLPHAASPERLDEPVLVEAVRRHPVHMARPHPTAD